MTTSVQRRRGTTTQHNTFTGLEGEITIDTTKDTAVVHDGSTVGGFPLAKETLENAKTTNLTAIVGSATAADDTFLIYDTSASAMKKITRAELNNAIEVDALANVTITGGTINGTSVGATTASTGRFSTLEATGVSTFSAGTVSAPAITTTGDTNTGIYFPAADTIAFTEGGAEVIRITSSGTVQVGAQNGSAKLNVTGDAAFRLFNTAATNQSDISFSDAQTLSIATYHASGSAIRFNTTPSGGAATERMRITSTGNLLVGTTTNTNSSLLVVNGTASETVSSIQYLLASQYDVGTAPNKIPLNQYLGTMAYQDSNAVNITGGTVAFSAGTASAPSITFTGDTNTGIFSPAADTIAFTEGGVESMRITSAGELLVGGATTLASGFSGFVQIEASGSSGGVLINSTAGNLGRLIFTKGNASGNEGLIRYDTSGYSMQFFTDAAERMRITSGGNVFMGATVFDVVGNRTTGFTVEPANGRFALRGSQTSAWATSASVGTHVQFYTDNGTAIVAAGSIGSNGSTTSYVTSSDYRLKENIAPMTGALDTVAQLKPITYNWKADGSSGQGFIAHELQAVVPDCVTGEKDAVDAEGKPVYQGIDTSFLVATLTAAIQEQQTLIENLTTRLNALEGK